MSPSDIKIYTGNYLDYEYTLIVSPSEAFVTFYKGNKIYDYKFTYTFLVMDFTDSTVEGIIEKIVVYRILRKEAIESIYI